MAQRLKTFDVRDEAHAFQARAISDASAPLACCTEHPEAGDVVVVWDSQPTAAEVAAASHTESERRGLPKKSWLIEPSGGHGQARRNPKGK